MVERQPQEPIGCALGAPNGSVPAREASERPGGAVACRWCGRPELRATAIYCSKRCRQTAWRSRRQTVAEVLSDAPKRLAYADPPYPGLARRYYGDEPTYAGEVDHARLCEQLTTYDGWALSTSRKALRDVLSLMPDGVVICPWVKTHHHPPALGPSNIHEYLLVKPARRLLPGVPDALVAAVARGGDSTLVGRKPLAFVAWMLRLLGAAPSDSLDDLFPGSGIVGRVWAEFCRSAPPSSSPKTLRDVDPSCVVSCSERRGVHP